MVRCITRYMGANSTHCLYFSPLHCFLLTLSLLLILFTACILILFRGLDYFDKIFAVSPVFSYRSRASKSPRANIASNAARYGALVTLSGFCAFTVLK